MSLKLLLAKIAVGDDGAEYSAVTGIGLKRVSLEFPQQVAGIAGIVGRGGIFGEMALIDKAPRMASVSALENTTCVIVTDAVFNKKMAEADSFLVALLRIFVRNIRSLTELQNLVEAGPKDESDAPPAEPESESERQALSA